MEQIENKEKYDVKQKHISRHFCQSVSQKHASHFYSTFEQAVYLTNFFDCPFYRNLALKRTPVPAF